MTFRLLRRSLLLALLTAALSAHPAAAGPPDLEQIVRERAEAHGQDADYLSAVIGCESGWNTRAVGARGELGLAQLKPGGELPRFFAYGYDDPFNAEQAIDYLSLSFAEGRARAWSCA